jgi:signal recognition particle subunit SRP54
MGPLREVFARLPGIGGLADQVDERELVKVESLIRSMTPGERARPETIDKSRAARIARGSGRRSRDVRELVDRFVQMREILGSLGSAGGLFSRLPGLGRLAPAGAPDLSGLLAGPAPPGAGGRDAARQRARQKLKRKQARKARKRNRRR